MDLKESKECFNKNLRVLFQGYPYSIMEHNGNIFIKTEAKFKPEVTSLALAILPHSVKVTLNDEELYFVRSQEKVNHPSHYGGADNPYEVIKVMEEWLTYEEFIGAMKFQQFKYLARAKKKDTEDENYAKATWYANYLTDYIKRRREEKS